ncbi:uncharacterized protein LOC100371996 [Saccoglossus kowalevskii]|uniref:Uncharacterized protein LOC100371996 n=1 Tax=Saccoglossus kowalevskii TaxID=10224 RepID=A0ABM0H0K4_SACKO|nr:PREDICTED: uncharacterized protein LOC100371996 [Saccoglossus kowalevskii]
MSLLPTLHLRYLRKLTFIATPAVNGYIQPYSVRCHPSPLSVFKQFASTSTSKCKNISDPSPRTLFYAKRLFTHAIRTIHSTTHSFSNENVVKDGVSQVPEIKDSLHTESVQTDEELKKLLKEMASDFDHHSDEENNWKLESFGKRDHTTHYVFNIDELVEILREENTQDICVIEVPKHKQYVDYFVIVSCQSVRHLQATTQYINQMYKQKKRPEDPFVKVEGKHTEDWMCIDLGNIVLHLFLTPTRELYELEKLWTLGAKYDDQLRYMMEQAKQSLVLEDEEISEDNSDDKTQSEEKHNQDTKPRLS